MREEGAWTCASPTTTVTACACDAQSRRKSKTVCAATTYEVSDSDNRNVVEYNAAAAIQIWYACALGPDAVLNRMDRLRGRHIESPNRYGTGDIS